ncbi:DUF7848 domain-containing protein [Streptomyces koyangensis]|uniref:DUF7848 domain-containing protein n=1 Tax=Streptomyces koyangensis TaxID=188770 RepID=A0A385DDC8_9ACTN|nr:hypothetical protein D0C37_16080 [Streptomyces koyangensis]
MSRRAVFRFVRHTMRRVEGVAPVCEVFCAEPGCGERSSAGAEAGVVEEWALRHAGRTGHGEYRRVFTDRARVTREG